MIKKLSMSVILIAGLYFVPVQKLYSAIVEVTPSTFTGDFSNGGEYELNERLLGNASNYGLGFIQNNQIRLYLSSEPAVRCYAPLYVNGVQVASSTVQLAVDTTTLKVRCDNLDSSTGALVNMISLSTSNKATIVELQTAVSTLASISDLQANIDNLYSNARSTYSSLIGVIYSTYADSQSKFNLLDGATANLQLNPSNTNYVAIGGGGIVGVLTVSSLTAYGTITSSTGFVGGESSFSSMTVNGSITASSFHGDGSGLTNLPSGGGVLTVYDEGSSMINVTSIDFTGLGVSVTSNAAQAIVVIAGGAGASTSGYLCSLIVTTDSTNNNDIVITAKAADVMGNFYVNISTRLSMNKTGAGGSVSDNASTWYNLYLISNGSTVSFISELETVYPPTMPAGYTKWRYVSSVHNDNSSNITAYTQYDDQVLLWLARNPITTDPTPTLNTADLTDFIPKNVKSMMASVYMRGSTATGAYMTIAPKNVSIAADVGNSYYQFAMKATKLTDFCLTSFQSTWIMNGDQNLKYETDDADDVSYLTFWITAYTLRF